MRLTYVQICHLFEQVYSGLSSGSYQFQVQSQGGPPGQAATAQVIASACCVHFANVASCAVKDPTLTLIPPFIAYDVKNRMGGLSAFCHCL